MLHTNRYGAKHRAEKRTNRNVGSEKRKLNYQGKVRRDGAEQGHVPRINRAHKQNNKHDGEEHFVVGCKEAKIGKS